MVRYSIVGLLEIDRHCGFHWTEEISSGPVTSPGGAVIRTVEINEFQCEECIDQLRRLAARSGYRIEDLRPQPAIAAVPAEVGNSRQALGKVPGRESRPA